MRASERIANAAAQHGRATGVYAFQEWLREQRRSNPFVDPEAIARHCAALLNSNPHQTQRLIVQWVPKED